VLDAQPVQRPAALRELLPDSPSPSRMETVFSITAATSQARPAPHVLPDGAERSVSHRSSQHRSSSYFLSTRATPAAQAAFLRSAAVGTFNLVTLSTDDLQQSAELVERYTDLPPGAADASVIAVAERLDIRQVLDMSAAWPRPCRVDGRGQGNQVMRFTRRWPTSTRKRPPGAAARLRCRADPPSGYAPSPDHLGCQ